ncbi:MAG: hypothetical protein KBT62_09645 [Sulfitobacter litoralis]|nr:hypothetical protein [Sulfitobacter litoralis]MCF7727590.1 hypothetical protein [Sulfitobacter sp. M22]MCF7776065.1 hypothetical protein [Sulfitobacter sp. M220]MBQ0766600.1 hypothetical protein [Sulfitobacter litoralis]MBQ0801534.1 hypothetical protein [Sulfitobacter litoralis]
MRPVEQVRVDQERLGILYDQLGETGAEDVVCRAMEELALRMSHCNRLYQASNWPELRKNCRSLIAIAEQVGLEKLAHVAGNVICAIDQTSPVAIGATLTRLIRIGDRSLTAIWDTHDFPL